MAMMASPATTWPFSSATMTLSASPSRAMPRSAPFARTAAAIPSGCMAPQLSLMFRPLGSTWSGMTFAPSSSKTAGATW